MMKRLKINRYPFSLVKKNIKKYELREDRMDDPFTVGDIILLKETKYSGSEMAEGAPLEYTKDEIEIRVTNVLRGPCYGLEKGWVIISFERNEE